MFVFIEVYYITDYNITGYLCWNYTIHGRFLAIKINRFLIKPLDAVSYTKIILLVLKLSPRLD